MPRRVARTTQPVNNRRLFFVCFLSPRQDGPVAIRFSAEVIDSADKQVLASMSTIQQSRVALRFDAFKVDLQAGELCKQAQKVRLQKQPFQILEMLLEHPGKVITREELRKRIWPADTFVDFEQGLYNAIKKLREALGDTAETPRYIETLPRKGYRFVGSIETSAPRIESLAVLPLENLSGDPEQEYFADGMTEALISSLAKIGALRVVSRTTAMRYKKTDKTLPQIARELNVDAVVEGTVLRSGKRLRISAQLIQASTDTHLWAQSYDRNLRDVLTLQSEVAAAIAQQVQVKLTPLDQARFAEARPVDPEAYEAYLKGRYHWNRRSGEGFAMAVQYFQQAIAKDPAYAAAYAGLADCLSSLGLWSLVSPDQGCGKAKGLALQALELDPGSAEAHASLAWATTFYDYDFAFAERELELSIELNPRYVTAHQWLGWCLAVTGRYEEGYTELKRAIRLDPLSSVAHFALGFVYWCARRYDQAIEQYEKAIELDPNSPQAHGWLGWALLYRSMDRPGIAALRKAVELSQGAPAFIAALGEAFAAAGELDEAQEVLQQLKELSKRQYVSPYHVGRFYAALGDKNEALRWLETAYRERGAWMVLLKTDPRLDPLRCDPRFQDLLRRMNFPP
jgi:TolB-like protein/Tfp pilus assembly protein PilF